MEGVGTAFLSAGDLLVGAGKGKSSLNRDWALGPKGPLDGQCEISKCVCWASEGGDLDHTHPTPTPIYLSNLEGCHTLRNLRIDPSFSAKHCLKQFSKFISHMICLSKRCPAKE